MLPRSPFKKMDAWLLHLHLSGGTKHGLKRGRVSTAAKAKPRQPPEHRSNPGVVFWEVIRVVFLLLQHPWPQHPAWLRDGAAPEKSL